uniref:Uncharacterized protein n=1 Tax=Arundo donax TaxID=35708 RepID=A0A0A9D7F5_ARUDO
MCVAVSKNTKCPISICEQLTRGGYDSSVPLTTCNLRHRDAIRSTNQFMWEPLASFTLIVPQP